MTTANQTQILDPLPVVLSVTSMSRATLYRLRKAGAFPAPVRISTRRVAWRRSDIEAWMNSL